MSPKVSVRNKLLDLTSVLESGVTSQVIDEGERWSVPPSGPVARFSKRRGYVGVLPGHHVAGCAQPTSSFRPVSSNSLLGVIQRPPCWNDVLSSPR